MDRLEEDYESDPSLDPEPAARASPLPQEWQGRGRGGNVQTDIVLKALKLTTVPSVHTGLKINTLIKAPALRAGAAKASRLEINKSKLKARAPRWY